MKKDIKLSEMAKEANEFENLAEKAMPEKERIKYAKDLESKLNKEKISCGALLQNIGYDRQSFLMCMIDLQSLGSQYQKFRNVEIDKWTAKQKQIWRKQKEAYFKKFIKIYKAQHINNIKILTAHKILEKRLGFKFEFSHNNIPMAMSVAVACIKEDMK